jgi:hypothetical protein
MREGGGSSVGCNRAGAKRGSGTPATDANNRGEVMGSGTSGGWLQAAGHEGEAGSSWAGIGGGVYLE